MGTISILGFRWITVVIASAGRRHGVGKSMLNYPIPFRPRQPLPLRLYAPRLPGLTARPARPTRHLDTTPPHPTPTHPRSPDSDSTHSSNSSPAC